ncbi:Inorganic phosphate transporter pho84 [Tulasnella sp. JGI-2019a]|nr:Inorganic phosphate transporter pho84 [Tulasnella sp. JGI-2019a]KAG9012017.1 Inorganic phosphate transporter pho84 [Tulasnella sp. JGI-2019a]
MIGLLYSSDGTLSTGETLALKIATPVGSLFGQLIFGWLADVVGRKRMYGVELIIMLVATFGQTIAGQSRGVNIFGVLVVWRFIMGIGIGGDYPLSAVITAELAATKFRGRMMSAVFAMQGIGSLIAGIVALIAIVSFKEHILHAETDDSVDRIWRIVIGVGMVPAALALYFRMSIPETPRFTMDVERDIDQAEQDANFVKDGKFERLEDRVVNRIDVKKASRRDFKAYFSRKENLKVLFGCAWSWFALDFAFYGLGLNPSIIFSAIGFGTSSIDHSNRGVYKSMYNLAVGNIILSLAGLIPGYWLSFVFIDLIGRKAIQLIGFCLLGIIFLIMGFGYGSIVAGGHNIAFAFLYALANLFQNFGPNTTTFIIPGEVFPTRYRATAHGISAASGKLGAVLAQVMFTLLLGAADSKDDENKQVKTILITLGFFMLTGIWSTLLLPETKGRTLEDLSNEQEETNVYLQETFSVVDIEQPSTSTSRTNWIRFRR